MQQLQTPARPRTPHPRRRASAPFDAVLTGEGKALLEEKAEELRTVTLPALLKAVTEDRRDELTRLAYEDKVVELHRIESVLAQAGPIPTQAAATDQVSLGDRITVAFLPSTEAKTRAKSKAKTKAAAEATEEFLLVHPFEAPLDQQRISVTSPLGRAVLGHRVGDVVTFDAPARPRTVRILERTPVS